MVEKEFKYDVALSFAGEDREYVDKVANVLKDAGVKVFYDKFQEAELWGENLYIELQEIYRNNAKHCVVFLSKNYKNKIWTNHEMSAFLQRILIEPNNYLLPVRIDETYISEINTNIAYINANEKTSYQLSELILLKLGKSKNINSINRYFKYLDDIKIDCDNLFEKLEFNHKNIQPEYLYSVINLDFVFSFNIKNHIEEYINLLDTLQPDNEFSEEDIKKIKKEVYNSHFFENHYNKLINEAVKEIYIIYRYGIIKLDEAKTILKIYIESKLVSLIRILLCYTINKFGIKDWQKKYLHLPVSYSVDIMNGLPYVIFISESKKCMLWIGVDLLEITSCVMENSRVHIKKRLYLPDYLIFKFDSKYSNVDEIYRYEIINYIIPQILEYNSRMDISHQFSISNLLNYPHNYEFYIRFESAFDLKTLNYIQVTPDLKNRLIDFHENNGYNFSLTQKLLF